MGEKWIASAAEMREPSSWRKAKEKNTQGNAQEHFLKAVGWENESG